MSYMLPFVFNTIRKRTIDPANARFFLPRLLEDTDGDNSRGKLLPIEEDNWALGPITGEGGNTVTTAFVNNWATYLEKVKKVNLSAQYPIADPSTPYPKLSMGGSEKIVIDGLENIFVAPNPAFTAVEDGYKIAATLQVGYWDGTAGRVKYPSLSLAGGYRLEQKLVVADKVTLKPTGAGDTDIDGGGTVDIEVQNAFIDTVFAITVKTAGNGGRELAVNIQSLLFRGPDVKTRPSLSVKKLDIDASVSQFLLGVWEKMARKAIESPDGSNGIFQNINAALNQPGNLKPLSIELSSKLATAIDGLLGPADGTLAAIHPSSTLNPVDRYMFDRIRVALNSSASSLFLPQLLCQNQNPPLSPLHFDRLDLPPLDVLGLTWENGQLSNLVFTGLTNVQAPPNATVISDQDVLQFTGTLGAWNPPPKVSCAAGIPAPPATGSATFSVTPKNWGPLGGNLAMTVQGVQVAGSARASGSDDSALTIDITSLGLGASDLVSSVHLTLEIDSKFKVIINKAINTQSVLQKILDGLNAELAKRLPDISAQVTKYAREAVKNGLN